MNEEVKLRLARLIWANASVTKGGTSDVGLAEEIMRHFDVTVKPEPPVISDEELGDAVRAAWQWSVVVGHKGWKMRDELAQLGLEIVRKEVAE